MKIEKHLDAATTLTLQTDGESSFAILHDFPPPDVEEAWLDFLTRVEIPAHYDSPGFFKEPVWAGQRPFAVLALDRGTIVGVLTGLHSGNHVTSGLQSRPQICVDRTANFNAALRSLAQGLLAEAGSAKLITIFSWSSLQLPVFESYHFRRRE